MPSKGGYGPSLLQFKVRAIKEAYSATSEAASKESQRSLARRLILVAVFRTL